MKDVSRKMAKGAAWMVLMGFSSRILGLVSTLFLARLLIPEDFGLVALAATVLGLVEIMGAFNFDLALIQNQQAERRHYDTAWTLNLMYGLFTAVLMAALAIPASRFFGDPRLEGIMYVFGASALIRNSKNIGTVAFQKDLDFGREFVFVLVARVVGILVTVVLAYVWRTYWALAVGVLLSACMTVAISYKMHPFRPRPALSAWRELWDFSSWMLFSNIIFYVGNRGYDLIIGRIGGAASLGLYSVAYELANLPTSEIVTPATRAIFPGFAKIANDNEQLRQTFLRTAALIALLTIPAGAGVAVLAEPMVRILLGVKWLEAIPVLQILAVFGTIRAMQAGVGSVYLALGMTRSIAIVALPHVIVGLPLASYLLVHYGLETATIGVVVSGAIALVTSLAILMLALPVRLVELAGCYWRPLLSIAVMVPAELVLLGTGPAPATFQYLAWAFFLIIVGAMVYSASVWVLWLLAGQPAGAESIVLERLRALRTRKASSTKAKR